MAGLRRKDVTSKQRQEVVDLLERESDVKKVAKSVGLSTSTVYKIRRGEQKAKEGQNEEPTYLAREHQRMLMRPMRALRGIGPIAVHDYNLAAFYSRPSEPSWPVSGGRVWRTPNGRLIVRLHAEERLEWTYFQQHLEGDLLWNAVEDWKGAIAVDISGRMTLLDAVIQRIGGLGETTGLGWPVIPETGPTFLRLAEERVRAVSLYYVFRLYDQALSHSLGLQHRAYESHDFMPYGEDAVELGGNLVVYASEEAQREVAIQFFVKSQKELACLPETLVAAEAFRKAEEKTVAVKAHIDRLKLTVGFPQGTVCDGCKDLVG